MTMEPLTEATMLPNCNLNEVLGLSPAQQHSDNLRDAKGGGDRVLSPRGELPEHVSMISLFRFRATF